MSKLTRLGITIASAMLLAAGTGYGLYVYEGYARGQREYASLENEYILPGREESLHENRTEENLDENTQVRTEEAPEGESEDAMSEKRMWGPLIAPLPEDAPERLSVKWNELLAKNEDVTAWITVPAADISYPVLQAEDNEYYLHRDINKEYLFAGSVFLDAGNDSTFLNYNTIIYGHNMRDGSMFARLKELQSKESLQKCRYFWIMTPEADMLYEIFSVHFAAVGSDTFMIRFGSHEEYMYWLDKMKRLSVVPADIDLRTEDRVVTLSTCTEDSGSRMTVQGKLIWKGNPM